MPTTLRFTVKDADSEDLDEEEGIDEDYQLEEVEISEGDFVRQGIVSEANRRRVLSLPEFKEQWESMEGRCVKKFRLATPELQVAVDMLLGMLGMMPVESSGQVPPDRTQHTLNAYGTWLGGMRVFARVAMKGDDNGQTLVRVAVHSPDQTISDALAAAIH
jgi:hypothetical protein